MPTWISNTIDLGTDVDGFGTIDATIYETTNCSPHLFTRTSPDGSTWDAWIQVAPNAQITSNVYAHTYAQIKMLYSSNQYPYALAKLPTVYDLILNVYRAGSGGKYPSTSSRNVFYNGIMLDLQQRITDTLGGDTAIYNQVQVTGTPYQLSGNYNDDDWDGTSGFANNNISPTNPLYLSVGTKEIQASVNPGMDIAQMGWAANSTQVINGVTYYAAVQITWGTAAGTAIISEINPSAPVISINCTTAGIITGLSLWGKMYNTQVSNFIAYAYDDTSIKKYGLRVLTITNPWIVTSAMAQYVANNQLALYTAEANCLYNVQTSLQPSIDIGDRVTAFDSNTGISADYWVVSIDHTRSDSQAYTTLTLWLIP